MSTGSGFCSGCRRTVPGVRQRPEHDNKHLCDECTTLLDLPEIREMRDAGLAATIAKSGDGRPIGIDSICPLCSRVSDRARLEVRVGADRRLKWECPGGHTAIDIGGELAILAGRSKSSGRADEVDRDPDVRVDHDHGPRVVLTPASAITPERVKWLEAGRVPLQSVTVVAGEPGLGKSTYTGSLLPAKVSRGLLDGDLRGEPRDVLIASAEDSWGAVIVPRLMAANADLDRVHRVEVHDADGAGHLVLPDDAAALAAEVRRLRERGRPVAMLVVDPIGAFLSAGTDSHRDASVRRALGPLAALAEQERIVVLVVAHLSKNDSAKLLSRITGSGAFGAAARSVLAFARDPEDPDGDQGSDRVIVHVKSNWGRYAPTLAARLEGREVDLPDGDRADVGIVTITGESSVTADQLQATREEASGDDVEEAIGEQLKDGPRPSSQVKAAVVGSLGVGRRTVERAAQRLVDADKIAVESGGFPRATKWALVSGAKDSGATEGGATDATAGNGAVEPNPGGSWSQSRHDPGVGATEAVGGADESLLDYAERLAARNGDLAGEGS